MPNQKLVRVYAGVLCLMLGLMMVFAGCTTNVAEQSETSTPAAFVPSIPTTEPTMPTQPAVTKISTATIGSTGDLLMHDKVILSGYDAQSDTYDYDSIFSEFSRFVSRVDYAVANLEVTLCGQDNGFDYGGYPQFNSPDAIVDAVKNAGFDMLLTANNHSYDTGYTGLIRTQQILNDRGLPYTGTRLNADEKNYLVQDINGIRVGMICYTYDTSTDTQGIPSLNKHEMSQKASQLVNHYSYENLPDFYEKLAEDLVQMRLDGAEATMLYIHWGDEYQIQPNATQKEMAQALCDLGIDVIVGNHAHVIQPVELLTNSQNESQKTLCLYSMGNALSNIRESNRHPVHAEDGLLFSVTFAKYSDGTVLLESAEILPTWVNRFTENGVAKYQILVMDGADPAKWQEDMTLTEALLEKCQASYDRTQEIVAEGRQEANAYLEKNQTETELRIGCNG